MISVRRAGVEPANPQGMAGLRPVRLANAQSSHVVRVAQAGVEPADHQGLSLAALPICVPRHLQAPSTGFGPAISCVTGRRALRAAPRGHDRSQWLRWESNPQHREVLSQGGLPVAYRAMVPRTNASRRCPESNPQTPGFKPSRSASLAYLGASGPGRTRTAGRHLVRVLPLPLGYRTVFVEVESPGVAPGSPACDAGVVLLDHDPMFVQAEAVGLEPTSGMSAAACFPSRFLNRSDGFPGQAAEAGVEPT